jgi:CDGSH-type Zn-finger protein
MIRHLEFAECAHLRWRIERCAVKVNIIENGPIILDFKGLVAVDIGGVTDEKTGPIALCRCGKSSTKPFCDGAHRDAKFEAPSVEISAT